MPYNFMLICVSEEIGLERFPIRAGSLALSVHPAMAAPAGETSAHQTQNPKDLQDINTTQSFICVLTENRLKKNRK